MDSTLQECFDHADRDMFWVASDNNIDVYADLVSEFIRKCIGGVLPTVTIKTFLNHKPWIDGSICAKLKRTTAFKHGKATGNMTEYKQCSYSFLKAIKQAKRQYRDKVESQFNGFRHETYVAGSTVNHGLQKENQPRRRHGRLAPRQTKQLLCAL